MIEAGAVMNEADNAFVGWGKGSTGTATVEGASSTWTIANTLTVGLSGTGSLTISDGGVVSSASGDVGTGGLAATVSIDGTGSQWTMSGQLVHRPERGAAVGPTVTISNGANLTTSTSAAADDQAIADELASGSVMVTTGGVFEDVSLIVDTGTTFTLSSGAELVMRGVDPLDSEANLFVNGAMTLDDATLASAAGGITIGGAADNGPNGPQSGTLTASSGSQITSLITRLAWNSDARPDR